MTEEIREEMIKGNSEEKNKEMKALSRTNKEGRKSVVGLPIRREEAIAVLTECYGANLLELEEFERRTLVVEHAQSLEEINDILLDLPEKFLQNLTTFKSDIQNTPKEGSKPIKAQSSKDSQVSSNQSKSHDVLSILSERRLKGNWLNSDEVKVVSVMGSSRLSFKDIAYKGDIHIRISVIMGEVILEVPKSFEVVVNALPIMGSIKHGETDFRSYLSEMKTKGKALIKQEENLEAPRRQKIQIDGIIFMGECRIKYI